MLDKQVEICAKDLFDILKRDYPEHSEVWYVADVAKFEKYNQDFEKVLLNYLIKTPLKSFTREDLNKIAFCFDSLAEKENFALFFPKSLYETINVSGKHFLAEESVNDLCRFIASSVKVKVCDSDIINVNDYKKNILSLSFDSEPHPLTIGVDSYEIGKGESLIRGIKSKLSFNYFDVTLLYENEIKKFMLEKELHHVNWIRKITDLEVLQSPEYDAIILTNPYLYTPIVYINDEETDYIIDGVRDYNPLPETLNQYGKLLKDNGKLFLVAEYLAVDNKLLQKIQNESEANNLYVETIVNFYTMDKGLNVDDLAYYKNISSNFLLIVLGKGKNNTGKIKFLNIDNLMEDLLIEKLIDMRYGDCIIDNDYVDFISCGVDFENATDYHDLTDKLHYSMLEKIFNFNYEKKHYIEIAKKLYDEEYKGKLKESFSKIEKENKRNIIRAQINGMAQISESLGLYYGGSQDLENLSKAKKYLKIAKWCGKETDDYLKRVLDKITALKSEENPVIKFKTNFMNLYPFDATKNMQCELVDKTYKMLCEEFEERNWNKLQNETKIYLSTAVFTIIQYLSVGEKQYTRFDYSGVISLLMRALEYELGLRFGMEYIKFLQENYPDIQDYFEKNKTDQKSRNVVVRKSANRYFYCTYYEKDKDENKNFYFKTMKLLMGYSDSVDNGKTLIVVDSTFKEYIKKSMTNEYNKEEQKILAWIRNIVTEVSYLEQTRNDAAHGGQILNINTLIDAFNTLILVKKVLKELVMPF